MRIYLDSSALLKRVLDEPESDAFESMLEKVAGEGAILLSSMLAWIEVSRAVRSRLDYEAPAEVAELVEAALSGIVKSHISEQVESIARRIGPAGIRSLDAIHLATATLVGADVICAYDKRLLTAANELGFRTVAPGRPRAGSGTISVWQ